MNSRGIGGGEMVEERERVREREKETERQRKRHRERGVGEGEIAFFHSLPFKHLANRRAAKGEFQAPPLGHLNSLSINIYRPLAYDTKTPATTASHKPQGSMTRLPTLTRSHDEQESSSHRPRGSPSCVPS